MLRLTYSWLYLYGIAVSAVALLLLLMLLLDPLIPMKSSALMLCFPPVIVSAWHGSLGLGLLATALASLACAYFLLRLQQSEERYRHILETAGEGIWIIDAESKTSFANSKMAEMLGYTADEMLGMPLFAFMDAEERAIAVAYVERRRQGIKEQHDFKFRCKDGSALWGILSTSPIFDKTGQYTGALGIVIDVTERKQIEEERTQLLTREQEARAAAEAAGRRFLDLVQGERQQAESELREKSLALENAVEGISRLDTQGHYITVNRAYANMVGYQPAEMLGMEWQLTVYPEDRAKMMTVYQSMLTNGKVETEVRGIRKDGSIFYKQLTMISAYDKRQVFTGHYCFMKNITERKRAEEVLRESEERFRIMADSAPVLLWMSSYDALCTFFNKPWLNFTGRTLEQELGNGWTEGVYPEDLQHCLDTYRSAFNARQNFIMEYRLRCADGEYRWLLDTGVPRFTPSGNFTGYIGSCIDITDRKQAEQALRKVHEELEIRVRERTAELALINKELLSEIIERKRAEETVRQSEERFRSLSACSPVGIFLTDVEGYCTYTNPRCQAICAFTSEQALGVGWVQFAYPDAREGVVADWFTHARAGQEWSQQYRLQLREGIVRWSYVRTSPMFGDKGELIGHVGTIEDITSRKQAEEKLLHNALYDPLTGLPNRSLFIDRLQHAIEYSKRHKNYLFAVLFLDLDRFKVINDSLGHTLGDQLLIAVASRLKACLRPTDTAARLGGDEFTILLEGIKDVSDTIRVASRIQEELALPFALGGQEVFATTSIGIALNDPLAGIPDYDQPSDLLRDADTAMYRAKALGKARYEIFNSDMYATAVGRLQLETDLRRAMERQEFRVYYQPIVSLKIGRIIGFEALVRWQHPRRGLLTPEEFLPVVEETGLSFALDQWVLQTACRQMRSWQMAFPTEPPLSICVNFGSNLFAQANLIEKVNTILHETGLDAPNLKLEITESAIMENAQSATDILLQLKALGIQLLIDDFGTGYSSLGRLHSLPINVLKIDRSFISHMGNNDGDLEIVGTIVTLAHSLGVDVTAEGVETKEQLALIRELNCEYGQGYFFSVPLVSEAAEAILLANPQW